jgi:hypothetical protein
MHNAAKAAILGRERTLKRRGDMVGKSGGTWEKTPNKSVRVQFFTFTSQNAFCLTSEPPNSPQEIAKAANE